MSSFARAQGGTVPPLQPGGAVRALFLTLDGMGWSTYARALVAAAGRRPDLQALHIGYSVSGLRRAWSTPMPGGRGHLDAHVRRIALARRLLARWAGATDLSRFDVVHVTPQHYALGLLEELARLDIPLSVGLDATVWQAKGELGGCTDVEIQRRFGPLVDAERAVYEQASLLVAMNSWAAAGAVSAYDIPSHRVEVVPPGLPPAPTTPTVPLPAGPLPRIAFVGNDWERKGGDRLLAWHQHRWAGRAELHVCSASARIPRGATNVVNHGSTPYAVVRGRLLPGMDLFVLPTRKDMSPWSVLEAAAAGVPVVSSAIGGIPDMVVDGVTGRLLDPDDDGGFVRVIDELLEDGVARRRMGMAARRHVAAAFDPTAVTDRLVGLVTELARPPRLPGSDGVRG
ncbi:MAG: glycosyltransferase family 4 protein [Acidimicrobiia bacterium]|nr:glycosyltransferase family 4 protein [Acidimicrobiia bacterium]